MGAFEGPRDWGRLLTALITPFHADGSVNYDEVRRVAAFAVDDQKSDGLVVNGTTGESPVLKEDEKLRVLDAVLETVGDRAAIVFGAGTYDTDESIHLAKAGEKHGAHGIMLVNPYYSKPSQNGLYAHFMAVAGEVGLPVILYNIQGRTAVNLETPTLLKLAQIKNIVAVKEASGNVAQIGDVCRLVPEGFRVYSGDDGLTLPVLSLGGHGVISVAGHVAGAEIQDMIRSFPTDPAKARTLHQMLTPLFKALFITSSPVPVKYATSLLGFDCERVRLPLVEMGDPEKAAVRQALAGLGRVRLAVCG
jgi:4-hydroxy-tetrahydrodipicolinate synthase